VRTAHVQLSATRCGCIAILYVSLVNFAAITLCVASQREIPKVSVYFFIESVQKLLDTPSYVGYESVNIESITYWRLMSLLHDGMI
jgi:hypothetical protein